jgi:MFS family permease
VTELDSTLSSERAVLIAAVLATSMAFIDATALNVALPALQDDLGATGAWLLWIINAYALPLTALLLFGGTLGDAFGRRRVFMGGILLFAVASGACGLAPNLTSLLAARAVQGIGAAFMLPGSLSPITAVFPESKRGCAIGTWSALTVVATVLGPILGGGLASLGLWRVIFFLNLPVAAIAIGIARKVPETRAETRLPLDPIGAGLSTIGLLGISWAALAAPQASSGDRT